MLKILRRRHALALAAVSLVLALPTAVAAAPPSTQIVLRTAIQSGSLAKYAPDDAENPGLCLEMLRAVERVDPGLHFVGLDLRAPLLRVERLLAQGEIDVFF
jgi:hypothetical protein